MIYSGVDYSLTSPSICVYDDSLGVFNFQNCKIHYLTSVKKYTGQVLNMTGYEYPEYKTDQERYEKIMSWAIDKLSYSDKIVLEDYSYGSVGKVFHIAENTGLLKYNMWKNDLDFVCVPPTVIKKFATGKGNSDKEKIQSHFIDESGVDVKKSLNMTNKQWNPSSDIIDSYYMCKYSVNIKETINV